MTLRDLDLLAFESRRYRHRGAKEEAITVELGMSPNRYEQRLNLIINEPVALIAAPMLVIRLRRLRDTRRAARRGA